MTKQIPLTQGKYAIVDDDDYERVSALKWCAVRRGNTWYAKRGNNEYMPHFILGVSSSQIVDHKDGNGLNNTTGNLRLASHQQNMFNRRKQKGSSRYKGVQRNNVGWMARISAGGKRIYLGWFRSEIDAANAYDKAAIEFHGEFAKTNESAVSKLFQHDKGQMERPQASGTYSQCARNVAGNRQTVCNRERGRGKARIE